MREFKIFILSVFPAPYRVGVFNELGKEYDVTVYFEKSYDQERSKDWFENNFNNFKGGLLKNSEKESKSPKIEILTYLKAEKYDLVLAYDYVTPTAALLMTWCKFKRIPYAVNCDGGFIKQNFFKKQIKKIFIENASLCLAGGENAMKYFLYYGAKEKNIYLHNFSSVNDYELLKKPIEINEKKKIREELGMRSNKIAISIGQFIYRKGFDVLIKAWANVNPEYELFIIGGGSKEKEYTQLMQSLKLNNIKFIGFKNKEELRKYYLACDLFILPTREDIWGLVINEAMSYGLPVITTDKCVAGLELIKNNENGFIVPVDNEIELFKKINYILSDDNVARIMSNNNINKIKPYTIQNIAYSHIESIKKILLT